MPVKIRLMRIGTKKQPFYRVVAVDERKKRTGQYLELLGTYNPLTEPKEIKLDQAKIDAWIKKGAQPSDGFLRITGKAPQRPPRKPKKEKGQATGDSVQQAQTPVENTQPQEEVMPSEQEAPIQEEAGSSDKEKTGAVEQNQESGSSAESGAQEEK